MLFSSAAVDALRTLLAFHFELSRIARRRPSRLFGRAAIGVFADSTTPRGSNTVTEFASVTFINMSVSSCFSLERASAVGTSVVGRTGSGIDRLEHRRAHVTPTGNEGRETSGVSAHDEQVDVVGGGHDRDAGVGIALQPLRKVAVIDLAVAVVAGDQAERVAGIHPEVMADVGAGPAGLGDRLRMFETEHDGAVSAQDGGVGGEGAHA